MATWQDFEREAPELATAVRARLEAHRHHVLATVRKDGSPRVSGTEVRIVGADLTAGSMYGSVKARDLLRDPRYALHANPGDGSMVGGDAKLAGRAVEIADEMELSGYAAELPEPPPSPYHAFRLELDEVVLTTVENDEYLLIKTWRPGEEVRSVQRR
ncbi:pyridoxamine 5'-phosphate oxidase family protein [Kitasatospora nipponensis]|uniref:Pyridoxamine 5'-phosphate oxidase family protein n=1 Tax=Kitasatospora nipponensis TaxID=258049 RepID=A0ABN1WCJ6_9ACTN